MEFKDLNVKQLTSSGYIRKCKQPEFSDANGKPTYEVLKPFKFSNKDLKTGQQFTIATAKATGEKYIDFTYEKETKKK